MWDINTFYYDSTSLMKNLAQSCFSGPCPDHVYLSLVVIGAELKEEIYVWHTSHRRTDTVFTHLIEKPAVLTSVSPRAKKLTEGRLCCLCVITFNQVKQYEPYQDTSFYKQMHIFRFNIHNLSCCRWPWLSKTKANQKEREKQFSTIH